MLRGSDAQGVDEERDQGHLCPPRDRASVVALEAVLAALTLAAAAVVVIATMGPGSQGDAPSAHDLQGTAQDTLRVLAASDGNASRRSPLPTLVADAIHNRSDELAERVYRTLPPGAKASLYLGNGLDDQTLVKEVGRPNSTAHARRPISPNWPTLHVVPDLRVYPADEETDMNVTALPLWASSPLESSQLDGDNVSYPNGFEAPLDEDGDAPGTLANLSIPNATGDADDGFPTDDVANITSNVTYRNETLEGTADYRTNSDDVFETTHDTITTNLEDATMDVAQDDVDLGGETEVTWDFTPVSDAVSSDLETGTDTEVHVAAFRPIPREQPALPGHVAARDYPDQALDGSLTLHVERNEVVGRWMVVAQLNFTLETTDGGVNQSARLVDTFTVRTPGSTGDPTPLYDLEIVAWYEGW